MLTAFHKVYVRIDQKRMKPTSKLRIISNRHGILPGFHEAPPSFGALLKVQKATEVNISVF